MSSTSFRRSFVASALVFALGSASLQGALTPAAAADARSKSVSDRAVAFIASQQRDDGGFGSGEAGFPGFETPDAVLAIAEAAQTTLAYDAAVARTRVQSVQRNGRDGLEYLDDLADGGVDVGKAAQLVIVAIAVGLNPRSFDPDGDGATDLVAVVDAGRKANGSYGNFYNSTAQVVLAFAAIGRDIPAKTVDYLRNAQQASGGYDFSGDPSSDGVDVDTTARVIQALVAARVSPSDPSVAKALGFLARQQNTDGSWSAFGSPDPNSTAQAILAIEAAGYDVVTNCWRAAQGVTATTASPDDFLRKAQAPDGHIAGSGDEFGVNTFATSQSVEALLRSYQPIVRAPRQACATTGYRLVAADGGVFTFGDAGFFGSTGDLVLNKPIVATAKTPTGKGYWLFATDGGVFSFGDAAFFGSTGATPLKKPIVAAAATPTGGGYWLFASDGGVFTFGDAAFFGSTGNVVLNKPIVGGEASASGRGYWLFASDGGVFTFGDAAFHESAGDLVLNRPIVAGVASRTGGGYLLFASDGGVFTFGDAVFAGSTGDLTLNKPIVSGIRSGGDGYYLVASDGGVFAFNAPFLGSEGARPLNSPVVSATR
ncbi:MAG TPA: prenyltransferase/squalene oxidase repeat-containing protein [Acidimicrobiales bacterium]|nr:prenyltransferase/squalene oxidase repeat-containing protein [Acidimicrobiales bacterium]